ncbi:MAG: hypothetical protein WCL60_01375 [Methylococcales bacterium]
MTAPYDHADSLRRYLTGATSDGGAQSVADASLGGFCSSTQIGGLVASITNPITGITITYVSPENATGAGTLTAVSSTTLAWTAPGGSQGPAVTVTNGATLVLEDGTDPGAYIIISSTVTSVTGAATATLSLPSDNVISMDDATPTETTVGSVRYRAIMLKNVSAVALNNVYAYLPQLGTSQVSAAGQLGASGLGTISLSSGNFNDWPQSGFCRIQSSSGALREIVYYSGRTATGLSVPASGRGLLGTSAGAGASTDNIYAVPGLRIAVEAPTTGSIQTIANDTTQPSGRTWSTGIATGNGVSIGTLAAGAEYGLWIERTIAPGTTATPLAQYGIKYQFDAA